MNGKAAAASSILLLLFLAGCAGPPVERAALSEIVRRELLSHGGEAEAAVWLGRARGPALYAWRADRPMPGASAVKVAFLVELFAAHAGRLDEPLPEAGEVLTDTSHPAIVHFPPAVQEEIRRELAGASVRRVGVAMIRGTGVSNQVYNAAANLTTAVLGGPRGLTVRIHRRDPAFRGIEIRRYMLARRDVTGDNEATAASLASVLQRLAAGDLEGVEWETLEAMRRVVYLEEDPRRGAHYYKSGSLDSDPQCRIRSGWYEGEDGRRLVYVVMVRQPAPEGELERRTAARRLGELAFRLTGKLTERVRGK
jgi:hypothetical protein